MIIQTSSNCLLLDALETWSNFAKTKRLSELCTRTEISAGVWRPFALGPLVGQTLSLFVSAAPSREAGR
jgi:hypothetical protein